jgi:hypothetical protein
MNRYLATGAITLFGLIACSLFAVKNDRISFSHKKHAEQGIYCRDCHKDIEKSTDAKISHLPDKENCAECHKDEMKNCQKCHSSEQKAKKFERTDRHLIFSHKDHSEATGRKCDLCHDSVSASTGVSDRKPAPMAVCLGCHDHKAEFNSGDCGKCHTDLKHFPLKPVARYSHEGNFVSEHKNYAKNREKICAQCHDYSFCSDCHAKTTKLTPAIKYPEKPESFLIHRADYVSRHAVEAKADPVMCRKCHGSSFCINCHEKEGISSASKNPKSPHPYNYTANHGKDARTKIVQCASCHEQGKKTNCLECHKSGGVNPHPASWTWRNKGSEKEKNKMCQMCHVP